MLLLDSYPPTLGLTLAYLLMVWVGPKYMKGRQAYSCRAAMMLYNLGITILSFWMFSEVNGARGNKNGCWSMLSSGSWSQLTERSQTVFFFLLFLGIGLFNQIEVILSPLTWLTSALAKQRGDTPNTGTA